MKRRLVTTADGSHSLRIDAWDEQYHSIHGAVAESQHVFIQKGLREFEQKEIAVLEMGFGTGLNAFMSLIDALKQNKSLHYTAVEAFPLKKSEWELLNYPEVLNATEYSTCFDILHTSPWEVPVDLHQNFQLIKRQTEMSTFTVDESFDLVYFDAFGYRVQPELWTAEVFSNMFRSLKPGGVLVTYAAKGVVRRTMQAVGFGVERLPGPPGKREMLRARKT
ncbi:MAG: tRNA (5-methylaminomethyl-2-thiouridine)(34)-methyltransferase MnmD [Flavobacteriaceae bacterium]